jgi:uncharacterized protein (DUF1499 family)
VLKKLVLLAIVAGAALALTAWPRLNEVETGRTPEYPDLQAQEYTAGEARVVDAVKDAMARLPGWTLVGSGRGPGGSAVTGVRTTRWLRFKDEVSVKILRNQGKSRVSIRSRSRIGKWDFGQNARNVRELQAELRRTLE